MNKRTLPSPPRTPPERSNAESPSKQISSFSSAATLTPSHRQDNQQDDSLVELPETTSTPDETPDETPAEAPMAPRIDVPIWAMPTSGELAFLAGLPTPGVTVEDSISPPDAGGSSSNTESTPVPETLANSGELFGAASRRWSANLNGRTYHRQDTWAIGERWGRHVRVIEVENTNAR